MISSENWYKRHRRCNGWRWGTLRSSSFWLTNVLTSMAAAVAINAVDSFIFLTCVRFCLWLFVSVCLQFRLVKLMMIISRRCTSFIYHPVAAIITLGGWPSKLETLLLRTREDKGGLSPLWRCTYFWANFVRLGKFRPISMTRIKL